jgi:hypothetical protein
VRGNVSIRSKTQLFGQGGASTYALAEGARLLQAQVVREAGSASLLHVELEEVRADVLRDDRVDARNVLADLAAARNVREHRGPVQPKFDTSKKRTRDTLERIVALARTHTDTPTQTHTDTQIHAYEYSHAAGLGILRARRNLRHTQLGKLRLGVLEGLQDLVLGLRAQSACLHLALHITTRISAAPRHLRPNSAFTITIHCRSHNHKKSSPHNSAPAQRTDAPRPTLRRADTRRMRAGYARSRAQRAYHDYGEHRAVTTLKGLSR